MKKLLIISVLLLSLSSCVSTKNIVDKPVEGTFIQIKNDVDRKNELQLTAFGRM
jgi:hypothetical protein